MTAYLWHITLDSGDIRRSPRSEVADGTITALRPHLQRAIASKQDIIPTTMYTLMATATGPFLQCTILGLTQRPILTFGVAPRARNADKLWSSLIEGRDFVSDPGEMPTAPWLAVRMEAGADRGSIEDWMADYERCIAWAWIEGKNA